MPIYERCQMCAECPFRANAPSGWLGPWSIGDVEEMLQGDSTFICHTEVAEMKGDNEDIEDDIIAEEGQHCVGFLRYMSSLCKLSRDPDKAAAQRELKTVPDLAVIPAWQFRKHHEQMLAKKKGKK